MRDPQTQAQKAGRGWGAAGSTLEGRGPQEGCVHARKPRQGARLRSEGTVSRSRGPWKEKGVVVLRGSFRRPRCRVWMGRPGEGGRGRTRAAPQAPPTFRSPSSLEALDHLLVILPALDLARPGPAVAAWCSPEEAATPQPTHSSPCPPFPSCTWSLVQY